MAYERVAGDNCLYESNCCPWYKTVEMMKGDEFVPLLHGRFFDARLRCPAIFVALRSTSCKVDTAKYVKMWEIWVPEGQDNC